MESQTRSSKLEPLFGNHRLHPSTHQSMSQRKTKRVATAGRSYGGRSEKFVEGFGRDCQKLPPNFSEVHPASKAMESQTRSSKRAPRELQHWRVQANPPTLCQPSANPICQPFANPSPTFSANPLSNPLFPWTPGTHLETRVNGFFKNLIVGTSPTLTLIFFFLVLGDKQGTKKKQGFFSLPSL